MATGEIMGTTSIEPARLAWLSESTTHLEREMTATRGAPFGDRLSRGLRQIAAYWQAQDGDREVFENFVRANFAADQGSLDALFDRFQRLLEQLDGHMHEIGREFRQQADLDLGPILPLDEISAGYDPGAHIADDFFENKLAFIVLLNFPLTTLDERITEGPRRTRRQWAEVRLAQRFSKRIPAAVQLGIAHAAAEADTYISQYNIWMHHVVLNTGERLFPPRLRLLSHWSLRDEIKASYEDRRNGLAKQRVIQQIMERIITQTIPHVVIDNPAVDWNPFTNEVSPSAVSDSEAPKAARTQISSEPEPDRRYAMLLKTFRASRKADPYSPTAPTLMARRFDEDREIPEAQAQAMLERVVGAPLAARVGNLIQERLGRPLEPFDIWYNGFRQPSRYTEAQLDEIVSKRYPAPQSYQKDIPRLLLKLGFSAQRAQYLADHIVVDPARGAGPLRTAVRARGDDQCVSRWARAWAPSPEAVV